MKGLRKFLLRHELLIIILCLVSLLRLPSLMEPYWYGDEGIYLTLGQGIRHGLTLYRDIHDNKPPGIYFLAAIAGSLFWFRFMLLAWNLASITVFHWIAGKLLKPRDKSFKFGGLSFPRPTFATLATLLFALLPFIAEGNIANGEIFMVLPTLAGFALLLTAQDEKRRGHQLLTASLAGLSFSLAFLIKVPAVFDAIAAGLFFFVFTRAKFKELILNGKAWAFTVCFALPILISILYYAARGAGQPYISAALLQNVGYLSSWSTGTHQANLAKTGLGSRGIALLAATAILFIVTPKVGKRSTLLLLWFGFALFGALLSERPYPHYMIQVIPPLALMIPAFFLDVKKRKKMFGPVLLAVCGLVLIISIISLKFWNYPFSKYFQNYLDFVTRKISRDQYFSHFDASLPEQYKLAEFIATYSLPSDRIFIWGDLPSLYALTRRLPPGRFTATYHVKDFNGYDETFAAILRKTPKYILIDRRLDPFTHISGLLQDEYNRVYSSKTFELYRQKR